MDDSHRPIRRPSCASVFVRHPNNRIVCLRPRAQRSGHGGPPPRHPVGGTCGWCGADARPAVARTEPRPPAALICGPRLRSFRMDAQRSGHGGPPPRHAVGGTGGWCGADARPAVARTEPRPPGSFGGAGKNKTDGTGDRNRPQFQFAKNNIPRITSWDRDSPATRPASLSNRLRPRELRRAPPTPGRSTPGGGSCRRPNCDESGRR